MIRLLKRLFHVHDYTSWIAKKDKWGDEGLQSRLCKACGYEQARKI